METARPFMSGMSYGTPSSMHWLISLLGNSTSKLAPALMPCPLATPAFYYSRLQRKRRYSSTACRTASMWTGSANKRSTGCGRQCSVRPLHYTPTYRAQKGSLTRSSSANMALPCRNRVATASQMLASRERVSCRVRSSSTASNAVPPSRVVSSRCAMSTTCVSPAHQMFKYATDHPESLPMDEFKRLPCGCELLMLHRSMVATHREQMHHSHIRCHFRPLGCMRESRTTRNRTQHALEIHSAELYQLANGKDTSGGCIPVFRCEERRLALIARGCSMMHLHWRFSIRSSDTK